MITMFGVGLFAKYVGANEEALKKFRNYTPEQISVLPEKTLYSEVPQGYSMAARTALSIGSDLLFGMQLNSLMYQGLHDYKKAVEAFQKDLNEEPTGVLTVGQIRTLEWRASYQKFGGIYFSLLYTSFKAKDFYGEVQGTLTLLGDEKLYNPINHTYIYCSKADGDCRFKQINLQFPEENAFSYEYIISEKSEDFTITWWSEHRIDAVLRETGSGCRDVSLSLNFKTKEFYYITKNGAHSCNVMGVEIPKLKQPRIAQFVDGDTIISTEFANVQKKAFKMLSKEFQSRIEKLSN